MRARLSTVSVAVAVWYATRGSVACVIRPICMASARHAHDGPHLHLNKAVVALEAGPLAHVLLRANLPA